MADNDKQAEEQKMKAEREAKRKKDLEALDPVANQPTPTQEEMDNAMRKAAPGEFPPEGSTDPQKAEEEAKRKKDLEAGQTGDYQTRAARPTK